MDSFSEVIERLGIGVAARVLGLKESHVRTLKARDSIPPTYFGLLARSPEGIVAGITFELLHRLHDELIARRSAEQQSESTPSAALSTRKRKAA